MITLYKFGPLEDVCDPSPFCAKVEAYCRLAGIPYATKSGAEFLRTAPKGKLPYIETEGIQIPDSSFIIYYLQQKYNVQLDAHLSLPEQAIAHAFTRLVDENLYWVVSHSRWKLEHNWSVLKQLFFHDLPIPLKWIVPSIARRRVIDKLNKHGLGKHTDAEIFEIGTRDLTALSDFLSDKAYFFGNQASSFDAIAYGILSQFILIQSFSAPIFDKAKTYQNLVNYTQRMHQLLFQNQ